MGKINRNTGNLLTCIFEVLTGILLLINPVGFTSAIIVIFGIVIALIGSRSLFRYFHTDPEMAAQESGLAKGLIYVIFGLFCVFKSEWFIITFPLLTVLYGILALISGVSKVQWAVDMLRTKQKYWYIEVIGAALTLSLASLLLPPDRPVPRRDALIEGGGDPWMQIPYHRRSIGVDPDSKWDFGND